jgi:hypothetical protein
MRRFIWALAASTVLGVATAPTADAARLTKANAREAVRQEVKKRFNVPGTVRITCADRRGDRIRCRLTFVQADDNICADNRAVVRRRRDGTLRVRGLNPKCATHQPGGTPPPSPAPPGTVPPPTAPPTEPPGPAAPPGTEPPSSDRGTVARAAQLFVGCYPRDSSGILTYTLDPWYQSYYVYFCLYDHITWYEYDYYWWTAAGWQLWVYLGYVPATRSTTILGYGP